MKKALITGINGQDGSYLAEYLLGLGYAVSGTVRPSSLATSDKLIHLQSCIKDIELHPCDILDFATLAKIITTASSFVNYTFADESSVMATNFNGTYFLLSLIKEKIPHCRIYFAGSSEMFGNAEQTPQDETTPFNPRSIYGISKIASHFAIKNARRNDGLFACTGITYNHESPRRGKAFVTQKIAQGVAHIAKGHKNKIKLGNIDALRDWGYAPEYVQAMHAMLQNPKGPKDYVIATGTTHSVRDFLTLSFQIIGHSFSDHIEEDKMLFRPSEKVPLIGNPTAIKQDLGWSPQTSFPTIVAEMVEVAINAMQ
jgi:GDPmannose 4,6-dehydratase